MCQLATTHNNCLLETQCVPWVCIARQTCRFTITHTCLLCHVIYTGFKLLIQAVSLCLHDCQALCQHFCLPLQVFDLQNRRKAQALSETQVE